MRPPPPPSVDASTSTRHRAAARIRLGIVLSLHAIMALELVALVLTGAWASGVWLLAIMAVTGAPMLLGPRLPVRIPAEYELLAILFVFASLFLGEFHSYYERFWWWDIVLHSMSGLLLGIVGFLLVYVLNQNRHVDLHMRPGFVALFAFTFAVSVGVLWEILEFAADQLFGLQMQKPMLGDPSGLTDTMWDLIVDALGAALISAFGWWHMKRDRRSFIDVWTDRFVAKNPRLFGH
ncbi:MAG: hypothetical protein KA169_01590 [Burkholderiaceae bacterium]|nr:hypothetical protein [Burkholderiaceae bacterium]